MGKNSWHYNVVMQHYHFDIVTASDIFIFFSSTSFIPEGYQETKASKSCLRFPEA